MVQVHKTSGFKRDLSAVTYTGFAHCDEEMAFHRGDLLVIRSGVGSFGVQYTNNIVYNAIRNGSNVLYLKGNSPFASVHAMQLARHTLELNGYISNLNYRNILHQQLTAGERALIGAAQENFIEDTERGQLRVERLTMDVAELEYRLQDLWESGFHFDMVVVDSLAELSKLHTNVNDELAQFLNHLKSLTENFCHEGFFCVVLSKFATWSETYQPSATAALTPEIEQAATYIQTLVQSKEEMQQSIVRIYTDKIAFKETTKEPVRAKAYLGQCYFNEI